MRLPPVVHIRQLRNAAPASRAAPAARDSKKILTSIDPCRIMFRQFGGEVAQSVEQGTENPRVHSSILCLATIFMPVTLSRTPSTSALCTGTNRAPVSGRSEKLPELPRENGLKIHTFHERAAIMSNVVIIGTQWGDEGKGKIVDILTEQADVVVRFQGGPNAGHTVVIGGTKTILHQIPSGILNPGKQCIIGNGVVLDLETLLEEIKQIRQQGYFTDPSALKISGNASLIMPYHKKIDIARERMKGKNKIGTTGRGIGPAYEDKVARNAVRFGDIFNDELLREKIEAILPEKNFYLSQYLGEEPLRAGDILESIRRIRDQLRSYPVNASLYLDDAIGRNKKILFEGAQGTMLDVDHGTYPFVTSSNTTAAQAAIGSGVGPRQLHTIVGIAKAYTTRVGEGPFPTELLDETGEFMRTAGGEFGSTTGRPRRCGWFDLVVVKQAVRLNSISCIALTKLDVLSGLDRINICTGYRCGGSLLDDFPTDLSVLRQCEPVYETMPGWKEDLSAVTAYEALPLAARNYVSRLEELTGVEMCMVSVGVQRAQNILRSNPFDAC